MRGRTAPQSFRLRRCVVVFLTLCIGGLGGCLKEEDRPTSEAERAVRGRLVVEGVGEGSVLKKADLRPGDVLLTWERLPHPGAHAARGELTSPFDWLWLKTEQAPRGTVRLRGQRGGRERVFVVSPGLWEAETRPAMAGEVLETYLEGRQRIESENPERGLGWWQRVVESEALDRMVACWMLLEMGQAWAEVSDYERALSSYRSALEEAETPRAQVVVWNVIAAAFEKRNEFENARDAYMSAHELSTETWGEDSLHGAATLHRLGTVSLKYGRPKQAAEYFERALEIRQRLAPNSLDSAATLGKMGMLAQNRGNLEQAIEYYEEGLRTQRKLAPGSLVVAGSLNNLGIVAWHRGELDRAAEYYERALEIQRKRAPDGLDVAAGSLNNLGLVAWNRGRLDQAASYYEEALEIQQRRAPDGLGVAATLDNLGILARHRGGLDGAIAYYERALEIRQRLAPDSLDVASSLINLGNVAWDRGDLDRATAYYEQAMEIRQRLAPESLDVAVSLHNLGNVASDRGEWNRATAYHERALEIWQKLAPESLDVAASLHNLGIVALKRGDLGEAAAYYERALEARQRVAPDSLDVAETLHALGQVAFDRGELDRATDDWERSLAIQQELAPGGLGVAVDLNSLGNVAQRRGDLKQAAHAYERALAITRRLAPKSLLEAEILHGQATTQWKEGRLQQALTLFYRTLDALEGQVGKLGGSRHVQAGFRARYEEYYQNTIELELELHQAPAAFHTLERSRAQSFLAQLAERDLVFAELPEELLRERRRIASDYDRIQHELAALASLQDQERIEAAHARLRQLEWERDDVEAEVRRSSPGLASLQYPEPLDLHAARRALDRGTVLLSYSVGNEAGRLFILDRDGDLEAKALPIGTSELEADVKAFLELVQLPPGHPRTPLRLEAAARLYQLLVQPAEGRIERSERVLIVPDGPLHVLPMAALVRRAGGNDWEYFVEWKPLHTVLSVTVYDELKKRRRSPETTDAASPPLALIAFGDAVYPEDPRNPQDLAGTSHETLAGVSVRAALERGHDFSPLPYTRQELKWIAEQYPPETVRTYVGEEATEERAKSIDRAAHIVHFATHGKVDDDLPLNSYVALTIPKELSSGRDNGLLQVWEIFEQMRMDADLVVLSACDTGRGRSLDGEGLIGLTRAFQYAGGRSVAASLWQVSDQETAHFMARFYRYLKGGASKDEALRAAQLEFLHNPIQVERHGVLGGQDVSAPYYWAAFQMYGDWK